jgi:hypothetical protein
MRRILFIAPLLVIAGAALAHPSLAPHEHPHDVSALPDIAALALGAFVIGVAWLVVRRVWRM